MAEGTNDSVSLWNRIQRVARTEGLPGLARRMAERGKEGLRFLYCYLLVLPLEPGAAVPQARIDLQVENLTPDNLSAIHELAQIFRVPAEEGRIINRLANNEFCFIGRVDQRIVGYVWIHHAGVVEEFHEKLFSLAYDEVYYHDAFVLPEMRGKNIYTTMKAITGQIMAAQYGKRRAISFVRHDNLSSLSASRKLGAQRIGSIGYVRLFGKRFRYLFRSRPRRF